MFQYIHLNIHHQDCSTVYIKCLTKICNLTNLRYTVCLQKNKANYVTKPQLQALIFGTAIF